MRSRYFWRQLAVVCLTRALPAIALSLAFPSVARAAESVRAQVTFISHRVQVQAGSGHARVVAPNEVIANDASLRTSSDAALELTFDDGSFARLSRNTDVQMQSANHFSLHGGAILLHIPQHPTTTEIETSLVSAATNGATFAIETYQPKGAISRCRITVLEGTVRVCRSDVPNECTSVEAKHAFFASADQPLGASVQIDLGAWLASNPLVTLFPPLKPALLALIGAPAHANMALAAVFGGMGTDFNFSSVLGTMNPANLALNGNEVSPSQEQLTIRHNGVALTLPREVAEAHLHKHSGDSTGLCR